MQMERHSETAGSGIGATCVETEADVNRGSPTEGASTSEAIADVAADPSNNEDAEADQNEPTLGVTLK